MQGWHQNWVLSVFLLHYPHGICLTLGLFCAVARMAAGVATLQEGTTILGPKRQVFPPACFGFSSAVKTPQNCPAGTSSCCVGQGWAMWLEEWDAPDWFVSGLILYMGAVPQSTVFWKCKLEQSLSCWKGGQHPALVLIKATWHLLLLICKDSF